MPSNEQEQVQHLKKVRLFAERSARARPEDCADVRRQCRTEQSLWESLPGVLDIVSLCSETFSEVLLKMDLETGHFSASDRLK